MPKAKRTADLLENFSKALHEAAPMPNIASMNSEEYAKCSKEYQGRKEFFQNSFVGALSYRILNSKGSEAWNTALESAVATTKKVYGEAK